MNIILIFSLERYNEVVRAFLEGLERARGPAGCGFLASVVSFLISRVDTEVDARLDAIDPARARALRGALELPGIWYRNLWDAQFAADVLPGLRGSS